MREELHLGKCANEKANVWKEPGKGRNVSGKDEEG